MADLEKTASAETADTSRSDSFHLEPLKENNRTSQDQNLYRSRNPSQSHSRYSRHSTCSRIQDDADMFETLQQVHTAGVETETEREAREPITYTKSGASMASAASRAPEFEVLLEADDPENPRNWPIWYRAWAIFVVSFGTWVVVLYSTSYTGSTLGLMEEFGASKMTTTMGVTSYLLGLATGSLVLAPMSELYGRQRVYLVCMSISTLLIIPCGMAKSLTTIIVVRFIGAFFGAVMIANAPGTIVDISNPDYLSLGMSLFSIAPFNGPVTGPIIGGFVFKYKGWRWTNWIVLIIAGVSVAFFFTLKETYAPEVLKRKAARLRKETDDPRWWCQYDQKVSSLHLFRINLSRPFVLFVTEPILWFINIWTSLLYGILYLCFVAYPVVFGQHRGWGPDMTGLSFLGIGAGIMLAIGCEPLCRRIINSQRRDPETGKVRPEAAALIMGFGTTMSTIGQLGFSWTCLPTRIHWAVPIAFGVPFGAGNTLSFVYGSNYLAGAYGIYAASALASNAVLRSIFGGTLPLAGAKMLEVLSPQWAGTLLGLLLFATIPIPFIFWRYGSKIRSKSKMIRQLQEQQDEMDTKRARNQARLERCDQAEAETCPETVEDKDMGSVGDNCSSSSRSEGEGKGQ